MMLTRREKDQERIWHGLFQDGKGKKAFLYRETVQVKREIGSENRNKNY